MIKLLALNSVVPEIITFVYLKDAFHKALELSTTSKVLLEDQWWNPLTNTFITNNFIVYNNIIYNSRDMIFPLYSKDPMHQMPMEYREKLLNVLGFIIGIYDKKGRNHSIEIDKVVGMTADDLQETIHILEKLEVVGEYRQDIYSQLDELAVMHDIFPQGLGGFIGKEYYPICAEDLMNYEDKIKVHKRMITTFIVHNCY